MGKKLEDHSEEELAGMSDDQIGVLAQGGELDEEGNEIAGGGDGGDGEGVVPGASAKDEGGDDGDDGAGGGEGDDGDEGGDGSDDINKTALQLLASEADESGMVPLARLNEVLASDRQKGEIIQLLLAAGKVSGKADDAGDGGDDEAGNEPDFMSYDFKAAQREYIKLITEGDEEAAIAKSEEIEETRAKVNDYKLAKVREEAVAEAEGRVQQREVKSDLKAAEGEIYKEFPFLDNKSKDASEAAILAVNAKAKQLIANEGMPPGAALRKAGKEIGSVFAKVLKPAANADGKKPPIDARKDGVDDPRAKGAVKRGLDASQPDTLKSGIGNLDRTRTLDISKMTDAQIDSREERSGRSGRSKG